MKHIEEIRISPSILSADFTKLGEEIRSLCDAGADYIHVDVMDGQFTQNITIGSPVVSALKKESIVPLDVHLMVANVENHVDRFIEAGSNILTFHYEAAKNSKELINYIKSRGVKAGISIVPDTPAYVIKDLIPILDWVLVMTVVPGRGGQSFMHSQLKKIEEIKYMINAYKVPIAVDGGINPETAKLCVNSGANILISGSYILQTDSSGYKRNIENLRKNCFK